MGLEIRAARLADVDRLLGPMADFNVHEGISFGVERQGPALERLIADASIGFALVAEAGGALAGYALVTYGYDLEFAGRDAWLTELYVLPASRGAGVGRALLREATRLAGVRGVRALHLMVRPDNPSALALYADEGFAHVPRGLRTRLVAPPEVSLRPARLEDRRRLWEWMACSDVTAAMMGPPLFPEAPPPTWAEFQEDYGPHTHDGSRPEAGLGFVVLAGDEPVGFVGTNEVVTLGDGSRATELDTWLASSAVCGLGYGRRALALLCERLASVLDVDVAFLQPSARNPRAIRAYEAAGFRRTDLSLAEAAAFYRTRPDYPDSVFLERRLR